MTRLLVTGAAGYLGRRVVHIAAGEWHGTPTLRPPAARWSVTGAYFHTQPPAAAHCEFIRADLRDADEVARAFDRIAPHVVIHTAGSNQSAEQVQGIEPMAEAIAARCARTGARLVHLSTDMVFGGDRAPYGDDAPPAPVHHYGEVKARAEAIVHELCPGAAIVRPSLIFGLHPLDHQTRWLVDGLRESRPVRLFTDERRCPIWVDNLALALLELAATDYAGPLNLTSPQCLNRWEFGGKLLSALGLEPGEVVRPTTIAESGLTRPANLTLDTSRARALLRTPLMSVDEALAEIGRPTTDR